MVVNFRAPKKSENDVFFWCCVRSEFEGRKRTQIRGRRLANTNLKVYKVKVDDDGVI